MKYKINCIYNYYDTLLSQWIELNDTILKGEFSDNADNLTQASGTDNSNLRSRAKECFRVGLLKHELTKGMKALKTVKGDVNVQSRFGFVVTLIYRAYCNHSDSEKLKKALAAINAIFSIIQPFEIRTTLVSVNTVVHRLLDRFPLPNNFDRGEWLRYLLSAFCCELKVAKEGEEIEKFVLGQNKDLALRIIENNNNEIRSVFKSVDDVKKAIEDRVSLTNIHHQKMPLFMIGTDRDIVPRGFYGLADLFYSDFLYESYKIESKDVKNSPFIGLYIDNEGPACKKGEVLETIKSISSQNTEFENKYQNIMKSIEDGAVEALMYLTDKPKSAFLTNWVPPIDLQKDKSTMRIITALRTKPFLLLAGISGTGKSQKVQELAFMTCPQGELREEGGTTPGNYCLIEVKPNWHDSTELLGYYSALTGRYELTDFIRFVYKAIKHDDTPFFLCLDEMNLAPVEQYFAEFLSVLETRKRVDDHIVSEPLLPKMRFNNCKLQEYIHTEGDGVVVINGENYNMKDLYQKEDREIMEYLMKNGLSLPDNLFVIGTVNMDDTTLQFSRKVIDRAFTIEMNGGKLSDMFTPESKMLLEYRDEPLPLDAFKSVFVRAHEVLDHEKFAKYKVVISEKIPLLLGDSDGSANTDSINGVLNSTPFRVSYRVQNELVLYLSVLIERADFPEPDSISGLIAEATLAILLEKVLPRIQGEQKQLETQGGRSNVLKDLKTFVEGHLKPADASEDDSFYKEVVRKLTEMNDKLSNYYTNFF